MKWEAIDNYTSRAKIKGGWLVKAFDPVMCELNGEPVQSGEHHIALCFVPDPMHGWKL